MIKRIFFFLLLLISAFGFYFWYFIMPIPTGYAAKNLCSCIFVDGYTQELAEANDLNFSFIGMTRNVVDVEKKQVRSTLWGLQPQVAVYRGPKFGCSLVRDKALLPLTSPDLLTSADTVPVDAFVLESDRDFSLRHRMDSILRDDIQDSLTRTRAWLVIHRDSIIGEQYAEGFDSNSLFLGWSMTKSILATMAGVLVRDSMIRLDDKVPAPSWEQDAELSKITWRHLLQMNAGFDWDEVYSWRSTATRMLYMEDDMFAFTSDATSESPCGDVWQYSSGTSNLLSGFIRAQMKDDAAYHALPFRSIADPIGMDHLVMELDAAGNFVGSSYSHATAREWGRFGLLYLHDGVWNGTQILPPGWTEFVSTPADGSNQKYGAHFWLNRDGHLPDVPRDTYYADGFMGQRIFIIPSLNLVVVRLGLSLAHEVDFNQILSTVAAVIESERVRE